MINRDQLIRYCRQELDEEASGAVEAAIQQDPELRELFRQVALEALLEDVAGEPFDDNLLLDENDPELPERRATFARQLDECRRSEWWSLVPDDAARLADLADGESVDATVHRLRAEEDEENGLTYYHEDQFALTVQQIARGRYRFRCDGWPDGYRMRSLRLAQFDLPGFPEISVGELSGDDQVELPRRVDRQRSASPGSHRRPLATSESDAGGQLAAANGDQDVIARAERPGIRAELNRSQFEIRVAGAGPPLLAVAEMHRIGLDGKRRVERRAAVLESRREQRFQKIDDFAWHSRVNPKEVRVDVRPLQVQELYLLQCPKLAETLEDLLAEQPASSAESTPCERGYEVELWSDQYDLARHDGTCWALQMAPMESEGQR